MPLQRQFVSCIRPPAFRARTKRVASSQVIAALRANEIVHLLDLFAYTLAICDEQQPDDDRRYPADRDEVQGTDNDHFRDHAEAERKAQGDEQQPSAEAGEHQESKAQDDAAWEHDKSRIAERIECQSIHFRYFA